jgi:hypothetical protein
MTIDSCTRLRSGFGLRAGQHPNAFDCAAIAKEGFSKPVRRDYCGQRNRNAQNEEAHYARGCESLVRLISVMRMFVMMCSPTMIMSR